MDASPLSKLSAEIRNIIYDMVVFEDRECRAQDTDLSSWEGTTPPIAQVCQQMRNEVLLMCFDATFVRDLKMKVSRSFFREPEEVFDSNIHDFCVWLKAIAAPCYSVMKLKLRLDFGERFVLEGNLMMTKGKRFYKKAASARKLLFKTLHDHGFAHPDRLVLEPYDRDFDWELEEVIGEAELERLGVPITVPAEGKDGVADSLSGLFGAFSPSDAESDDDES